MSDRESRLQRSEEGTIASAEIKSRLALTAAELIERLKTVVGWEPVETILPGDPPKSRQELRKAFAFRSFQAAIDFMSSAVDPINQLEHHPRWENQWRTVTVYLTTWDIGFRISQLDIDLAKVLDDLYGQQHKA
jgi:pterin-4a-carbinolamine dehydratase